MRAGHGARGLLPLTFGWMCEAASGMCSGTISSHSRTHLERSLFRALPELQRLQALWSGTGGVPMAIDLDVSVGPRDDGRTLETGKGFVKW